MEQVRLSHTKETKSEIDKEMISPVFATEELKTSHPNTGLSFGQKKMKATGKSIEIINQIIV